VIAILFRNGTQDKVYGRNLAKLVLVTNQGFIPLLEFPGILRTNADGVFRERIVGKDFG
jgi:hypothetical protein